MPSRIPRGASSDLPDGDRWPAVPGHRIVRRLGTDAWSTLYVALPATPAPGTSRPVVLRHVTTPFASVADERAFRTTSWALSHLADEEPGLLRVISTCRTLSFDHVQVTELPAGGPLASVWPQLAADPLTVADAGQRLAAGLAAAHDAGLVHGRISVEQIQLRERRDDWALGGFGFGPASGTTPLDESDDARALARSLCMLLERAGGETSDPERRRLADALSEVADCPPDALETGGALHLEAQLRSIAEGRHAPAAARRPLPAPAAPPVLGDDGPLAPVAVPRWPDPLLDPHMRSPRQLRLAQLAISAAVMLVVVQAMLRLLG